MGYGRPRNEWKPDLDRYLDNHGDLDTWQPGTVSVNGKQEAGYTVRYGQGAVHVTDLAEAYVIVVTQPAVDAPAVREDMQSTASIPPAQMPSYS